MTIFLVECSGGEYEDCWNVVEKCFSSKKLADEYVEKRKKLIKEIKFCGYDWYNYAGKSNNDITQYIILKTINL